MASKTASVSKKSTDVLDKFSSTFLSRVPEDERARLQDDLHGTALTDLLALAATRPTDEVLVKVDPLPATQDLSARRTRILAVQTDRPFIVDSFSAEIARHGLVIDLVVHPSFTAQRDASGALTDLLPPDKTDRAHAESWMVIYVAGTLTETQCRVLEQDLLSVAEDVRLVTHDWQPMRDLVQESITELQTAKIPESEEDRAEFLSFLQYVHDNNFTLIGVRSYTFEAVEGKIVSTIVPSDNRGILGDDRKPVFLNKSQQTLPQDLQKFRMESGTIAVYKVNRKSTVHRRVPLDGIAIKRYDAQGNVVGERLFVGLFTSVTYSRSVLDVPFLRGKVRDVVRQANFADNSHDARALLHVLEKYPRDELFQIPTAQIRDYALSIMHLADRPRVALYTRVDPFRRYISALVYVPRERYETGLRLTIQKILEDEMQGTCSTFYTVLDDSVLARVTYVIETDQTNRRDYDFSAIERRLVDAARGWSERLRDALLHSQTQERVATHLSIAYEDAFPTDYQLRFSADTAVQDIAFIEQALETRRLVINLYRPEHMAANTAQVKLYHLDSQLGLSDVLPMLENMGARVLSELNFETHPHEGARSVWIQDFLISLPKGAEKIDLSVIKPEFEAALLDATEGKIENDPLNALILQSGMAARDVVILRSAVKYLVQTKFPFSSTYMMRALTDTPQIARLLVDLFHARFNPENNSADAQADIITGIRGELEKVDSLDQDRILRTIKQFIKATLRTNYYQTDVNGAAKDWISFKIDSAAMPDLPDPRPWREIFVYSPRMEGIHLRGGRIARGGIRWSDRPEDFRTEILGLMQAQMVKNSVIVPEGAKGGFVLKRTPTEGGRDAFMKEGIACYRYLVSGMLDVTDNMHGDTVVPPANVVRYDDDDPYIVAAADKGTATFSDIANALSADYGFWLGDAFASGGSAGYDHKKMGITARGAWEAVKRHFRETGVNIQSTPFSVIGVGDMGGDVFGNGMLLSHTIRLIGAFNHAHIFCDPNPNPDATWAERKRLFDAVKGWGDYDASLLSTGGRIYTRTEKFLELTPEIKAAFGIDADKVTPVDLIRAMLKTKCDLLWFGGIGTYIKASTQSHEEVGDKANDTLRVDASEIRATVIGEGANLGITRKARVELGLNGVKLNADFIDNSGGVDCSDHEVNIKILLTTIAQKNPERLPLTDRNELLSDMTDDIAIHVLRNSYQSAQAISMAGLDGMLSLGKQSQFIDALEREHGIKRKVEGLPTAEELDDRARGGHGLTRAELGILISHAKLVVRKGILASTLPDDPQSMPWLVNYFPDAIKERFQDEIPTHRLRREIIATQMAASIVNRLGPTFVMEMTDKTGSSTPEIAKLCFIVREAFGLRTLWHDIEALDAQVPAASQLEAMRQIRNLMDYLMFWVIKRGGPALQGSLSDVMIRFKASIRQLQASLTKVLPAERLDRIARHQAELHALGLPDDMAKRIAFLVPLRSAGDIIRLAYETGQDIPTVARLFFNLGENLHFDWLRQQARLLSGTSSWQTQATEGLVTQLYATQSVLVGQILEEMPIGTEPLERFNDWKNSIRQQIDRFESLLSDMRRVPQMDLAMLTLAEQRLRQLAG